MVASGPVRIFGFDSAYAEADDAIRIVEGRFAPGGAVISSEAAVDLVNRGGGGLVVSAYSNDNAWSEGFVLGVAPFHGRVWVGSDRMAEQALPPGMVLPSMIHGGPGRAGGGEELGALRGLDFYTQRTAIQGFKSFVDGTFGAGTAE